MDAFFAVLEAIGLFIPPGDDRGRRWHRIGCLVTLFIGSIIALILALLFFAGGL
jgi:hypothetical protein